MRIHQDFIRESKNLITTIAKKKYCDLVDVDFCGLPQFGKKMINLNDWSFTYQYTLLVAILGCLGGSYTLFQFFSCTLTFLATPFLENIISINFS